MIELETLAKVPLFTGVDTEALIFLQPCFKQLLVPKGTVIIKENTEGDQIFILVQGKVQVTKDLVKGFDEDQLLTEKVLATLSDESLPTFGENGLLAHGTEWQISLLLRIVNYTLLPEQILIASPLITTGQVIS